MIRDPLRPGRFMTRRWLDRSRPHRPSTATWVAWMVCLALTAFPVPAQETAEVTLDSHLAGDRPAQRISFQIEGGELETYQARVGYPEGFSLIGFADPAPGGGHVGAFELVFDVPIAPGADPPSVTVPLIGLGVRDAYADLFPDGTFSRDLEPRIRLEGDGEMTLRLPFGGDADPTTLFAPLPGRITLTLLRGPLQNPDKAGTYTVVATLQSVDPDTDGADDGIDPAPRVLDFEAPIDIRPALTIERASLTLDDNSIRGFQVFGRHTGGVLGDLAELPSAGMDVTFGNFARTLSGEDLLATGDGWIHIPGEGGLFRLLLRGDGYFQVDARTLRLPEFTTPGQETIPVRFSLRVGNHRAATVIPFDADGRHRP